jgi:hypothetical protein
MGQPACVTQRAQAPSVIALVLDIRIPVRTAGRPSERQSPVAFRSHHHTHVAAHPVPNSKPPITSLGQCMPR